MLFSRNNKNNIGYAIIIIFFIITFTSYSSYHFKRIGASPENVSSGPFDLLATELFHYIKDKTNKNDIFVFRRPRVLSFFTDRQSMGFHKESNTAEKFWNFLNASGASYIIHDLKRGTNTEYQLILKYQKNLLLVFTNSDFSIYRIKSLV